MLDVRPFFPTSIQLLATAQRIRLKTNSSFEDKKIKNHAIINFFAKTLRMLEALEASNHLYSGIGTLTIYSLYLYMN